MTWFTWACMTSYAYEETTYLFIKLAAKLIPLLGFLFLNLMPRIEEGWEDWRRWRFSKKHGKLNVEET